MRKIICMSESIFPLYTNLVFRFFFRYLLISSFSIYYASLRSKYNIIKNNKSTWYLCFFLLYSFSIIDGGIERLASFHINNNSANINKQPIKWYLSNRLNISKLLKFMFNFFYVYACFMYLMYIPWCTITTCRHLING